MNPVLDSAWNTAMQQPVPIIAALIGASITALGGGLVSGLFVHWLMRSREQEAWTRNCEKEEWRELFTAITNAEIALVNFGNAQQQALDNTNAALAEKMNLTLNEYDQAAREAYRVILDRIFIVDAMAHTQLMMHWVAVQQQFMEDRDLEAAVGKYATIKGALISAATKRKHTSWRK